MSRPAVRLHIEEIGHSFDPRRYDRRRFSRSCRVCSPNIVNRISPHLAAFKQRPARRWRFTQSDTRNRNSSVAK